MDAPKSNFVFRERQFWESTDLGIILWRRFLPVIAGCFGSIFIAASALTLVALGPVTPWLPALVIWWLKPLWERIVLAPVGLLFFEPSMGTRELFYSMRRVFSAEFLLSLFSHKRLSPYSAYLLPVDMFEHPDKERRVERRRWLTRGFDGRLFGLMIFFYCLDFLLFFSIYIGAELIVSVSMLGVHDGKGMAFDFWALNIFWFCSLLFTVPLYTLSAFSLYINRRTMHEGWDLRLALSKLESTSGKKSPRSSMVALILALSFFNSFYAEAIESAPLPAASESYEEKLRQIIYDPDFGEVKKINELRLKFTPESGDKPDIDIEPVSLGNLVQVIAIIIGATGAVMLLVFIIRRLDVKQKKAKKPEIQPDVTPPPTDVEEREKTLAESRAAWDKADQRLALSCLYQVGISLATKRFNVRLPASATEGSCMAIISRSKARSSFIELFARIVRAWIRVSWSSRPIEEEDFEQLYNDLRWEHRMA